MGALILPATHAALTEKLRFLQNAIGAVPSAFDCWLAQRGAKTLHLRMKQHGTNALAVARALENAEGVEEVIYPGLPGKTAYSKAKYELAWRMLSPHARRFIGASEGDLPPAAGFPFSGMISLRIRGGQEAGDRFLTTTRLFTLAESLGGVESLAEHPAQMTHGSIPAEDRELLGIGDNFVRLSVGVEGEDLVDDVLQAVRAATGTSSQTFPIRNVDNDTQFVHFFLLHFSISLCQIIKLHRYERGCVAFPGRFSIAFPCCS
jgi:cystathionine gamma-lyase